MIRLQVCLECQQRQYPLRDLCRACLSDNLALMDDAGDGRLLARTVLHRSSEADWQQALPLALGTVHLTSGAHLICFLAADVQPGEPVRVKAGPDPLGRQSLTAHRI